MAIWLRAFLAALGILAFSNAAALGDSASPATMNQTAPSATPPSTANPSIPEAKYAVPPLLASSTDPQRSDIAVANLPHDLSPWKMFLSADAIVKSVMIGLAFASMLTWTVGFAKGIELVSRKRSLRRTLQSISDAPSLIDASAQLGRRSNALSALINVAARELRLSSGTDDRQGIKERVQSRLDRIEVAAGRDMNRGTGILATIGSTAPFIGLFGTVWGIMNSFVGISQAQTTNLAVVAPGIAEALLATAFGLVAAIPAVFIYNLFARSLASYKALVGDAAAEVMRLVSRDLDRGIANRWQASKAAE